MTTVLVIDDSVEIRELLQQMLKALGYNAREAEGGAQGLDSYQAAPADVVLLDMFMPDMDGLETLRKLRQIDPGVRIIAMTGGGAFHNVGILKPASLMGANRLLFKPIMLEELRNAVEAVMAEPS